MTERRSAKSGLRIKHGGSGGSAASKFQRNTQEHAARRSQKIKSLANSGSQAEFRRRPFTLSGVKVREAQDRLKKMWADHPEIASREDLLALVPEAERDLDRRSLNVVAQVLSEGRKIGELDEAIIWEEILPDGTTREAIKPECKYLS